MKKEEITLGFLQFLEEQGVKHSFYRNLDPSFSQDPETSIEDFVSRAFEWSESPEGHDYWEEIDDIWRRGLEFYKKFDKVGETESSELGRKFDSEKPRMDLLIKGMPRALYEIGKVLTYGSKKYEDHNWLYVEGAENRYCAASFRHELDREIYGELDSETEANHLAHKICCDLFRLELILRGDK